MRDYVAIIVWGLVGAGINAAGRLYTALCEGEAAPARRVKQAAWLQFSIALATGAGLAASLTPYLTTIMRAPSSPIAITVGLCANAVVIALRGTLGGRITALVEALFGPSQPYGH